MYRKYIAPVGILLLLLLNWFSPQAPIKDKLMGGTGIAQDIVNSFTFTNYYVIVFLIVLLFTIWFGFKSWVLRLDFIRRKYQTARIVVFALMILIVMNYIKPNSTLGAISDWGTFLAFLGGSLGLWWLVLKFIDSLDLSSDLYCWGLRFVGAVFFLLSFFFFTATGFAMFSNASSFVTSNILWIDGILLLLLSAFCEFRSTRRYPMVKIW